MKADTAIEDALMEHYKVDPLPVKHKPIARAMWPREVLDRIARAKIIRPRGSMFETLYPARDRADAIRRML